MIVWIRNTWGIVGGSKEREGKGKGWERERERKGREREMGWDGMGWDENYVLLRAMSTTPPARIQRPHHYCCFILIREEECRALSIIPALAQATSFCFLCVTQTRRKTSRSTPRWVAPALRLG